MRILGLLGPYNNFFTKRYNILNPVTLTPMHLCLKKLPNHRAQSRTPPNLTTQRSSFDPVSLNYDDKTLTVKRRRRRTRHQQRKMMTPRKATTSVSDTSMMTIMIMLLTLMTMMMTMTKMVATNINLKMLPPLEHHKPPSFYTFWTQDLTFTL